MKKILKVLGLILLFAILVNFSPIIILVIMGVFLFTKGDSAKDKASKIVDKTKRIIDC